MKKIVFTLQDAPDFATAFQADIKPNEEGEYTVSEENALALLIYELFPNLKESRRRIKAIQITDELGETYETNDFDIYNSLKKKEDYK